MQPSSFANNEIIQVAEAVAREKSIPKEKIIEALEEAMRVAAYRKYGREHKICASIDRKTGAIHLYRELLVVDDRDELNSNMPEQTEDGAAQMQMITLQNARYKNPDALPGDILKDSLPPLDLARLAAQSAKQVIISKIKEIEREQQYEDFQNRVGDILHGIVDKVEHNRIVVKIGNADAVLRRDQMLKADHYKQGERIKAYLLELDRYGKGPQIILSRTDKQFIVKLFAHEVPEIYEGIIQVKSVARDPGSRAKVAVFSPESAIDPIGSCVGMRGARVQAITAELKGEKIDVIEWSSDPATLAIRALAPASATKVIVDEDNRKLEVVVPTDQQSIAIGRQGQNVRLASELIGWKIDILTEANEIKRRQDEFNGATDLFVEALYLDNLLAQLLASEGFVSIEDVAEADIGYLSSIQGLNEEIVTELVARAREYIKLNAEPKEPQVDIPEEKESLPDTSIFTDIGITPEFAARLIASGVGNMTELADLSRDELVELIPDHNLLIEQIDDIIMSARKHVYFS